MGASKTQKNKAHKTRFASKSSRNVHKVAAGSAKPVARSQSGHQRARDLRMQCNKDLRNHKRDLVLKEKRASSGLSSAPGILAIIPLSPNVELDQLLRLFSSTSADQDADVVGESDNSVETEKRRLGPMFFPKYKLRLSVVEAPRDDLEACLEVAKVADVIVFATVASENGSHVDKFGKLVLSMLRGLGLPSTIGLVMGTGNKSSKRLVEAKKSALGVVQAELPADSKCFFVEQAHDFQQILRHVADIRYSCPQWRSERPYIVAQEITSSVDTERSGTLLLTGYVRGRGLSVNQLIHVAGIGDFQCSQIELLEDPYAVGQKHKSVSNGSKHPIPMDEDTAAGKALVADSSIQEPLVVENAPDPLAGEQTWPTEDELFTSNKGKPTEKRLLPKGTSDYQASWIVDSPNLDDEEVDEDEDEGDAEGEDQGSASERDDEMIDDSESEGGISSKELSDWKDETDGQSDVMDDDDLSPAQRLAEMQRLRAAQESNTDFPDEMDTPLDREAKERFGKYRGLKSFRTSPWHPKESLPSDYSKIFAFENFTRTYKHVASKAREIDQREVPGCISCGQYIRLHIKDVPLAAVLNLTSSSRVVPVVACGLLQHESKLSLLHFSMRKYDGYVDPIKSKESLIFHTGFRQYRARPIFSSDDMNADKHKFERFLPPGQFAVASVYGAISFPPLPLIVLKDDADGVKLVAVGSLRSVDPNKIVLKRVVLSGFPHKVSKRKAVVRFMFHNPKDVRWFRPVELWTKYGRRGRIKEPVGTHGSMKCVFDGVIQQRDAVCMSLYKRVYPRRT